MKSLIFSFLVFDSSCFVHACCDLPNPCQSAPIDSAPRASQAKKRQALLLAVALGHAIGFRTFRIFRAERKVIKSNLSLKSYGGSGGSEERCVF